MKSWHLALVVVIAACNTKQKTAISQEAYANAQTRREMFEATLRVMDEHPEYAEEMYKLTLRHPKVLSRQFAATARSLADVDVARRNAEILVEHPQGLERQMTETLEVARDKPGAVTAIVNAMQQRKDIAARMLVSHPAELGDISRALVSAAFASPNTKEILTKIVKEAADPKAAARSSTPKR